MPLSSSGELPPFSWHFSQRSLYTLLPCFALAASNGCLARTNFWAAKCWATASASASLKSASTLHMSDLVPFFGPACTVTSAHVRVLRLKFLMLSMMYFAEKPPMVGIDGSLLAPFLPWQTLHCSATLAPSAASAPVAAARLIDVRDRARASALVLRWIMKANFLPHVVILVLNSALLGASFPKALSRRIRQRIAPLKSQRFAPGRGLD